MSHITTRADGSRQFDDRIASARAYFMLASTAAAAKQEVRDFMAWL